MVGLMRWLKDAPMPCIVVLFRTDSSLPIDRSKSLIVRALSGRGWCAHTLYTAINYSRCPTALLYVISMLNGLHVGLLTGAYSWPAGPVTKHCRHSVKRFTQRWFCLRCSRLNFSKMSAWKWVLKNANLTSTSNTSRLVYLRIVLH